MVRRGGSNGGSALTMGIEEEFYLVDSAGELVHEAVATIDDIDAADGDIDVKPELLQSQVESGSEVCRDHNALLADLTGLRLRLSEAASYSGAQLIACGTPIRQPRDPQRVVARPRYRRIAEHVGPFVVDGTTCGCHVHVGVPSREVAIAVSNHLRPWLPVLLALSANSPFHHSSDTGYASTRYLLWGRWPTSGPPPFLESVEHYEHIVRGLLDSGAALDRGMIYWDIRPSEHQLTVEIRVPDAMATATEAALLAILVRTLVAEALAKLETGVSAPRMPHEVLRANLWRAARDGLTGRCADPETGEFRPAQRILAELVPRCVGGTGEADFARQVLDLLGRTGGGADRQRAAFQRRGDWNDVVDMLAAQTIGGDLGGA